MQTLFLLCGLLLALAMDPIQAADEYSLQAAKDYSATDQATATVPDPRDSLYLEDRKRHDEHTMLQLIVLSIVAVATIVGSLFAARSANLHLSGRDVIRAVVLIFVIYGAVALAIDVKTTETLTGVIGVLSATAGYLFGRATTPGDEHEKPPRQGDTGK